MGRHDETGVGGQKIPAAGYFSRDWYDREQEQLFSRCWTYAAMTDDVPRPGDYRVVQAGLYSLFVVRGEDLRLRAFHNQCRHRGTQILEGGGRLAGRIRCPYHHWGYALDGSLRSVPRERALFPGLEKDGLGLLPASTGELRGLIFVHPDPEPREAFADFVGDLDARIGQHQPLEMVEVARDRYEFEANWKIVVENYLDGYHLSQLHDRSEAMFDHEQARCETSGRHSLFYEPVAEQHRSWVREAYGDPEPFRVPGTDPERFGCFSHLIFPNLGWVGSSVWWNTFHVTPVSPDRTRVEVRTRFTREGARILQSDEQWRERWQASLPQAAHTAQTAGWDGAIRLDDLDGHPLESGDLMLEDMWVCRQLQRSVSSPSFRVGALARRFESALSFHQGNVLDFVRPAG